MKAMSEWRFREMVQIGLLAYGMTALIGCSAQEPQAPAAWKFDCVGRMQLRLSSDFEVAANSFKTLEAEYKIRKQAPRFEFMDGQHAGYSSQYYLGRIFVSHPQTSSQRQTLLETALESQQTAKVYADQKKVDAHGKALMFESLAGPSKEVVAFRVNGTLDITMALDKTIVRATSHDQEGDARAIRREFALKTEGLALRSFGELPTDPGICLPYAFIRDDGVPRRSIGVTYRLQDHPDVTIWLEDSSASAPTSDQDSAKFTAEYKTDFFWRQRYQDRKSWRSLWSGTRDIQLDGRRGVASFVELRREDDTLDFGYLAVVRGDPDAKKDTPDLMLYVIRDAKNAIAKGMQPIDMEEFLKMAQTIAASIKHRAVK